MQLNTAELNEKGMTLLSVMSSVFQTLLPILVVFILMISFLTFHCRDIFRTVLKKGAL